MNRVTPEHEKLFLIVKVVVRLADPSPIGKIQGVSFGTLKLLKIFRNHKYERTCMFIHFQF